MDAPLSVKRLLEQVKARLEPPFAAVCVVGEVSNFRGSGKHWYFTLKEEGAALSCAVWAGQQRFLQHKPADGQRVEVARGNVTAVCATVNKATGKLGATEIPEAIRAAITPAPTELLADSSRSDSTKR